MAATRSNLRAIRSRDAGGSVLQSGRGCMRSRHRQGSDIRRPTYVEMRSRNSNAPSVFTRRDLDHEALPDTLTAMKPSTSHLIAIASLSLSVVAISVALSDQRGRFTVQSVLVPAAYFHRRVGEEPLAPMEPDRELVLLDTSTGRAWTYSRNYSKREFSAAWVPMGHTNFILPRYVKSLSE